MMKIMEVNFDLEQLEEDSNNTEMSFRDID